jgi:hypothetical protein
LARRSARTCLLGLSTGDEGDEDRAAIRPQQVADSVVAGLRDARRSHRASRDGKSLRNRTSCTFGGTPRGKRGEIGFRQVRAADQQPAQIGWQHLGSFGSSHQEIHADGTAASGCDDVVDLARVLPVLGGATMPV